MRLELGTENIGRQPTASLPRPPGWIHDTETERSGPAARGEVGIKEEVNWKKAGRGIPARTWLGQTARVEGEAREIPSHRQVLYFATAWGSKAASWRRVQKQHPWVETNARPEKRELERAGVGGRAGGGAGLCVAVGENVEIVTREEEEEEGDNWRPGVQRREPQARKPGLARGG